jgi:hypothetical protein
MMGVGSYLLRRRRDALPLVKDDLLLVLAAFAGLGDGGDELGEPPLLHDAVGGLARGIQLPVPGRVLVGWVEDRLFEEVSHLGEPTSVLSRKFVDRNA